MYTVLVPVDGDGDRVDAQLEAVRELAAGNESIAVDVLHAREELDFSAEDIDDVAVGTLEEELTELKGLPETVSRIATALREAGVETDVHAATGRPEPAILDAAERFDADLVVLSARRRSPVGKAVFGSVAQSVLLETNHPVMVVPS
ncbi:UspA domain-containing protein [Natronococcus amylolyticus DSM 10524]|uniref:UspA domain-containing protein n=1 Tax=Natronococcus amylolyticus DSM 10524 TaxID=1227497 RepID=L9X1A0_9EURY|nr:universal stress protein [Natronococcus amylolyticus]ELY54368.1 UspA domain-containing protein [Natronococcus amylolyticus DSM 10524]